MARRSRVEGPNRLRRKLRKIEPDITQQLRNVIRDGASRIAWTAAAFVPVDTGELRASIETKVSSDGMTAIIGPGAKAAEILETLYRETEDPLIQADLGLDLARNYVKLQRDADAERIYEDVAKSTANPQAAQDAKQTLAEVRSLRSAG